MNKIKTFVKKRKLLLITVLMISIAIYIGQYLLKDTTENTDTNETTIEKVKKGTIISSVETSGTVETANYLSVTTSVNGIVKKVFVKEGDTVLKGQKIMEVTLNSDGEESLASAWASYLGAKNSLAKAKSDLVTKNSELIKAEESFNTEKEKNTYQTHDERISYTLYENDYLTAKSNYEEQLSSIKQAEASLQKAWLSYQAQSPAIVAPDSGTIANILIVEGMDISNSLSEKTSLAVASIKKEGTPIVSLEVNELDINKIKVGQKVNMKLNAVKDTVFTGEVVGIDKIGTASNGITTYTVIVKFTEDNQKVLPNMGVDAEIIVEEKTGVVYINTAAITTKNGKSTATKVINGQNTITEITVGISNTKNTEILSGLTEGEEIIVNSLPTTGFTETQTNNTGLPGGGMGGGLLH